MIESASLQDALLITLQYLSFQDILSVSQTCKQLWRTCMAKQLWLHVWRRNVVQGNLPRTRNLPSLDLLDAFQMKALAIHTLRLHHEMTRTCSREERVMQRVDFPQSYPITWVRIVHGSWLLIAMSDAESSVLSLYSLQSLLGTRSQDLLAQAFLEGPVLNGLVEVTDEYGIIIALELLTEKSTLEVLSVRSNQGQLKFVRLAQHSGISHIRALHGLSLGFTVHGDYSVPSILNWLTGSVTHLSHHPDTDGSVISMILNDEYLVFLTPLKLHIMRICVLEDAVKYSTIAKYTLEATIWNATLAFCQEDCPDTVRLCTSNSRGMYVYSASLTQPAPPWKDQPATLLWACEAGSKSSFRMITQPLFDQTFTTISWLETVHNLLVTRSLPSLVQFVVLTESLSTTKLPLRNPRCFELSEREMPALYAQSTRDYDHGLGLLAIGNMMGELAIYSFSEDTLRLIQDALQPVVVPSWNGEDVLSQTPLTPYPPRKYAEEPGFPTEAERRTYQQLWDASEYWPEGLRVPDSWRRCTPYDSSDALRWLDAIGNDTWNLKNANHFLGHVIPLICTDDCGTTLLAVGGLFLLFHAELCSLYDPFFAVLRTELSLEEIVAQLPGRFEYDEDYEMNGAVANIVRPDLYLDEELQFLQQAGDWERRHGHDRWRDFKMRGGNGDIRAFWSEEPVQYDESLGTVIVPRVLCADECSLCGQLP